jgi:hypothetical protein
LRPDSVETAEQEEAVADYHEKSLRENAPYSA